MPEDSLFHGDAFVLECERTDRALLRAGVLHLEPIHGLTAPEALRHLHAIARLIDDLAGDLPDGIKADVRRAI